MQRRVASCAISRKPLVQRVGGGEEQPAVEPQHDDAGERLVVGVLVELAEEPRARLPPEQRDRGAVAT